MSTTIVEREGWLFALGAKRRRESRAHIEAPIEVSGFDCHERFFTERTSTLDVSDSGCRFCLRTRISRDSVISIRLLRGFHGPEPDSRIVLFRAVWVERAGNRWIAGAEKLQPVRLWPSLELEELEADS